MNENKTESTMSTNDLREELIITTQGKKDVDYTYDEASQTLTIKGDMPISLSGYAVSPINILIDGKPNLRFVLNELTTKVANDSVTKGELILTTNGTEGIDYTYNEEKRHLTVISNNPIGIGGFTTYPVTITVEGPKDANITLKSLSTAENSCFEIKGDSKATITIEGENELNRNGFGTGRGSGLCVSGEVVIEGEGSLKIQAGTTCAGIGGCEGSAGRITINGGRITAFGGWRAAGIGAGGTAYNGCKYSAGEITINGGSVITEYIGGNLDGFDRTHKGTLKFNGNAVLHVNVIAVGSEEITSGVFFLEKSGLVYGSPIVGVDWEILEDELLTIEEGKVLTIKAGTILTVNGKMLIKGKLVNNGTIKKNGTIDFTETGCMGGSGSII